MDNETNIKAMSQLYSRVFLQILDSSIAEDFTLRHVFEDLLKLANHKTGTVDMTRMALARRLNMPLDLLNEKLTILESPDEASRDAAMEGRRIVRLDDHRDWGWKIVNWEKYEAVRTKADNTMRVQAHRERYDGSEPPNRFKKPTLEEVKLYCSKTGLTDENAEWFFNKEEGNGWTNGGKPIRSWQHTLAAWKSAGYIPNTGVKKTPLNGHSSALSGIDKVLLNKELEGVETQMRAISGSYEYHQSFSEWSPEHQKKHKELKARRGEIKTQLGMKL